MGIEFMGDSCNLFNTILVSGEVRLEGLMFLLEGLELIKLAVTEVLALEHILLASSPCLMDVSLVLEFFGKMFKTFKPHHFCKQPFLKGLFTSLKVLPGIGDIRDRLALRGKVGRTVRQT